MAQGPTLPRLSSRVQPTLPSGTRTDAPPSHSYATGTATAALAIAADAALRSEAVAELRAQMWASSSAGPRSAREQLWLNIGTAAGIPNPMELSPSTITIITPILVKARYRSTANIVSQAICTFKRLGGNWTEAMELAKLTPSAQLGEGSVHRDTRSIPHVAPP